MFTEFLLKRMEITSKETERVFAECTFRVVFLPKKSSWQPFLCVSRFSFFFVSDDNNSYRTTKKAPVWLFFCCGRCAASRRSRAQPWNLSADKLRTWEKFDVVDYIWAAQKFPKKFMVKLLLFRRDFLKHFDGHHMYNVWTSCVRTLLWEFIHSFLGEDVKCASFSVEIKIIVHCFKIIC